MSSKIAKNASWRSRPISRSRKRFTSAITRSWSSRVLSTSIRNTSGSGAAMTYRLAGDAGKINRPPHRPDRRHASLPADQAIQEHREPDRRDDDVDGAALQRERHKG